MKRQITTKYRNYSTLARLEFRRSALTLTTILLLAGLAYGLAPKSLPAHGATILAILVIIAGLWFSELIPVAATALLIPVLAGLSQAADSKLLLGEFAHPVIFLFLGGFLLAVALNKVGLDRKLAIAVLQASGQRQDFILFAMILVSAFLSMWMSNTATVALMIPIVAIIAGDAIRFHRALVLGVAWAGTIGGLGSAIGTPANMMAITFLNQYTAKNISFHQWFGFGLPMVVVLLPVLWLFLTLSFGLFGQPLPSGNKVMPDPSKLPGKGQRRVALIFGMTLVLWLSESWHSIPAAIVALTCACGLFISQVLSKDDFRSVQWEALITFGGGLALGKLMIDAGIALWLSHQLAGIANIPEWLTLLGISLVTMVLGAFISNTACAAILIPIALPLAETLSIDPVMLVALIAISSSIDFALIIGTPPTMLAYSTGLFTTRQIFQRGFILNIMAILSLNIIVIAIWRWLGLIPP